MPKFASKLLTASYSTVVASPEELAERLKKIFASHDCLVYEPLGMALQDPGDPQAQPDGPYGGDMEPGDEPKKAPAQTPKFIPVPGRSDEKGRKGVVVRSAGKLYLFKDTENRDELLRADDAEELVRYMLGRVNPGYKLGVKWDAKSLLTKELTPQDFLDGQFIDRAASRVPLPQLKSQVVLVWAKSHLKNIGEGSSRAAFQVDEDHALKVALNRAGVAQNKIEAYLSAKMANLPLARVRREALQGAYMVVDLAHAFDRQKFAQEYGVSARDFFDVLREDADAPDKARRDGFPPKAIKLIEDMLKVDLWLGDLRRDDQWGEVGDQSVIVDYGINPSTFQKFYRN